MHNTTEKKITANMLEQYIFHLQEAEKSAATLEKYKRDIKRFLAFTRHRPVTKELTMSYKELLKTAYQPASINSMLAALNGFLEYQGWNDCRVNRLRIQRKIFCAREKELTKGEYERLIAASRQTGQARICLILQTICATGIRVSELEYITVEAVKKRRVPVECKGKIREVFLSEKLKKLLLEYIRKEKIKSGPVFVTRNGKPVHRSNIWKEMKALCKAAGVSADKVFPHNLRHLFARTFYELDKDISKLADVLGHSNVETTRGYIISCGDRHSQLVNRLGLVSS